MPDGGNTPRNGQLCSTIDPTVILTGAPTENKNLTDQDKIQGGWTPEPRYGARLTALTVFCWINLDWTSVRFNSRGIPHNSENKGVPPEQRVGLTQCTSLCSPVRVAAQLAKTHHDQTKRAAEDSRKKPLSQPTTRTNPHSLLGHHVVLLVID